MLELAGFIRWVSWVLLEETDSAPLASRPACCEEMGARIQARVSPRLPPVVFLQRNRWTGMCFASRRLLRRCEMCLCIVVSSVPQKGPLCLLLSRSAQPSRRERVIGAPRDRSWSSRSVVCFSHGKGSLAKNWEFKEHAGPAWCGQAARTGEKKERVVPARSCGAALRRGGEASASSQTCFGQCRRSR